MRGRRAALAVAAGCLALAAASLLLPVAPGYDPWSWLLWGREIAHLDLSTAQGPAFKPLPVAVTALLAPAGGAAPDLWLLIARTGALLALALGFFLARRLAGAGTAGVLAGAAAVVGIALSEGFLLHSAVGNAEPLFIGLVLGSFVLGLDGRHGPALALGALAALLRPECWPFLAAYAAWRAWLTPELRVPVALGALAIPAAWLVPEWLGSGDPLRSGARALAANPGAPALSDHPALESVSRALGLLFVPTALTALAVRGRAALLLAASGVAWLLLVGLLAMLGFSGEERYALPGAALIAVAGGVGMAGLVRRCAARSAVALPALLAAGVLAFAVTALLGASDLEPRLAHNAALAAELPAAIEAAGGRERLLACGRPAVGRFRGPLLAYHLDLEKRRVRADGLPGSVTFRSRLRRGDPLEPDSPQGAHPLVVAGRWRIETTCHAAGRAL